MIYAEKREVNQKRNKWASGMFQTAVEGFAEKTFGGEFDGWLLGNWSPNRPPKRVAEILDETTDIDLVEGIIECIREIGPSWRRKLAQEELLITLVGTGLDAIRESGRDSTDTEGRLS